MKRKLLAVAVCLAAIPAQAFNGRVVGVHDGDTVTVLTADHHAIKVRFANIDAPELGQPFGQRSKRAMSDLVFGKTVEVEDRSLDRYGRTIGVVTAPFNANEELVREGLAWNYPRYNTDPAMPGIEAQARAGRLGLWSQPHPIPPWEWRHHAD